MDKEKKEIEYDIEFVDLVKYLSNDVAYVSIKKDKAEELGLNGKKVWVKVHIKLMEEKKE